MLHLIDTAIQSIHLISDYVVKPLINAFWNFLKPKAKQTVLAQRLSAAKRDNQRVERVVNKMVSLSQIYELSSESGNILESYLNQAPNDKVLMQALSRKIAFLKKFRIRQNQNGEWVTEYNLFVEALRHMKATNGFSVSRYIKTTPVNGIVQELERQMPLLDGINARFNAYRRINYRNQAVQHRGNILSRQIL